MPNVRCLQKSEITRVPRLVVIALVAQLAGCAAGGGPSQADRFARDDNNWTATMPARDIAGWTIFRPDPDGRIIYVSSGEGDDAAAKVYPPDDPAVGVDPFRPAGPVRPFRTIAAALKNARDGQPDWVLLKKADQWRENIGSLPSGRDKAGPFLLSAYGDRSERPMLCMDGGLSLRAKGFHDIAIVGLEFYADVKDPAAPRFDPSAKGAVVSVFMGRGGTGRRLLLEDCRLRYMAAVVQAVDGGRLEEIALRRCLILDNYSRRSHAQGIFAHGASVLLEENVFDHNGWLVRGKNNQQQDGGATMFNHNTYFCDCYDTVFRGNMFLRGSSMGNKWTANSGPGSARNLTMDDNLYVEGEIGIGAGGNEPGPLRFKNVAVTNNVFMHVGRARPTDRDLGWNLDITDWDGGLAAGNFIIHQNNERVTGVFGIRIGSSRAKGKYTGEGEHCRNVIIRDNVIYGLRTAHGGIVITEGTCLSGISVSGNLIQFPGLRSVVLAAQGLLTGISFSNNTYFSGLEREKWFGIDSLNKSADLKAWLAVSGETGSGAREVRFRDPSRSVETYNASLGGKADLEDFIAQVRRQSRANWRREYTAAAVNAWVREGFRPAESK